MHQDFARAVWNFNGLVLLHEQLTGQRLFFGAAIAKHNTQHFLL